MYKKQCLHRLQISFSSWLVLQGGWAWDYINVCFSWMNAGNLHSYETPHEDDNELHDFIKSCWLNYFPTFIATSHIISLSNLRSFGRKKPIIGQIICMYSWDLNSCNHEIYQVHRLTHIKQCLKIFDTILSMCNRKNMILPLSLQCNYW